MSPATHAADATHRQSLSVGPIGHIYINLATGERIATRLSDDFRPAAGNPGTEQWIAANDQPCAAFGTTVFNPLTVDFYDIFTVDYGDTVLDWGDIQSDTVIDCLEITWFTATPDSDSDSDGIGDGVVGFGARWSFYDTDNGFNSCYRQSIVSLDVINLPGAFDSVSATYSATIDLADHNGSSFAFEYADSDGDPQGATSHNPFVFVTDIDSDGQPDGDLDGDGLADISYAVRYFQPGTTDLDNADGDSDPSTGIDGDLADRGTAGVFLSAPSGTTIETDNGDGTFSYEIDTSTATGANAFGAEDGWDEYDSAGFYDATYWRGGFTCEGNPDNHITPNPFGQIKIAMYGPSPLVDCGDHNSDGVLDIFDVFAFLDLFNAGSLAADYTGDGILDILDVFAFLDVFNAGCP